MKCGTIVALMAAVLTACVSVPDQLSPDSWTAKDIPEVSPDNAGQDLEAEVASDSGGHTDRGPDDQGGEIHADPGPDAPDDTPTDSVETADDPGDLLVDGVGPELQDVQDEMETVDDAADVAVDAFDVESGPPPGCEYNEELCPNDNNPCTDDYWCSVPVPKCWHEPNTDLCADARCESGGFFEAAYCLDGWCPSQEWTSCDDGNPCTFDGCDAGLEGGCDHVFNAESCDDGNLCTEDDQCLDGTCIGETIDCDCPEDDCSGFEDGGLCNGTLFCDTDMQCKVDPATVVTCSELNDPCKKMECVPESGECVEENINEGKPCAGSKCDVDGFHETSYCTEGQCPEQVLEPCNDDNACNGVETCDPVDGCQAGTDLVCHDDEACTIDDCNPLTGCDFSQNNDGYVCAPSFCDALTFYESMVCTDGSCPVQTTQECDVDDGNVCTEPACDEAMGCGQASRPDGIACAAAKCEGGDYYAPVNCDGNGGCPEQIPVDCDDGNVCTDDSCDLAQGGCVHEGNDVVCAASTCDGGDFLHEVLCKDGACPPPEVEECNDGDVCTGVESCDPQTGCVPGNPLNCDDGEPCNGPETCEPKSGCVSGEPLNCDDGDACNGVEDCQVGQGCQAGTALACALPDDNVCDGMEACDPNIGCYMAQSPLVCDDGKVCTIDACDPVAGCDNSQNNDGYVCGPSYCDILTFNVEQICTDGDCPVYTTQDCDVDDGNVCTYPVCDNTDGCLQAIHSMSLECTPATCVDGDFLPAVTCDGAGVCPDPIPKDCDDGKVCTDDSCDVLSGCLNAATNEGLACLTHLGQDGNCVGGECTIECILDDDCDDDIDCTADSCDGVSGQCTHAPEHSACDDANQCTDDECVTGTGCAYVNNTVLCAEAACQDGNFLPGAFCNDGSCPVQVPEVCNDGNDCTDDSCDPANGCANTSNTATVCHAGYCDTLLWYTEVNCKVNGLCPDQQLTQDCNDGEVCTIDACDPAAGCDNSQNYDGYVCGPSYCDSLTFYEAQTCTSGACPGYTTLDCDTDDGNVCTYPACDKTDGCSQANQPDSHECAAARCEGGDHYQAVNCDGAGTCPAQEPVDCDDGNPCTDDSCDPVDGCIHTANTAIVCQSGDCDALLWYDEVNCGDDGSCPDQGLTLDCDDGLICTVDACDPVTGCDNTQNNDGYACGPSFCDGLTFHQEQACSGGTCPAYTTSDCDVDDGNACTYPVCHEQNGCSQANQLTGYECAAAKCENGDHYPAVTCEQAGTCPAQAPVDCDDGKTCTADSCDPVSGCQNVSTNEGLPCVTHLGQDGKCNDGVCKAECTVDDQETCDDEIDCTIDSCNLEAGKCEHVPQHGDCDDTNECTDDACQVDTGCVYENNTALCSTSRCDDGGFYPPVYCSNGACPSQVVEDCADGNPCTDDSCDPASGCEHAHNTVICAAAECDGSTYYPEALCSGGACPSQNPEDCNDNDVCTGIETCDPSNGCVQGTPLNCVDSDPCNGEETCHPTEGCQAGSALACDNNDKCDGLETCVTGTGCVDGATLVCEDGDVCNGVMGCDPGIGCFNLNLPLDCDDNNVCTVDTCHAMAGCDNTQNNDGYVCASSFCDALVFNQEQTCSDLGCPAYTTQNCEVDDGNACTYPVCYDDSGCAQIDHLDTEQCAVAYCDVLLHYPEVYCDGAGTCPAQTPVNCDDGNPCTDDACDPATGCGNTNNTASCTAASCDGLTWKQEVFCSGGACSAQTPTVNCDDENPCTDDACDPSTGCANANNTDLCEAASCDVNGDFLAAAYCSGGACPAQAKTVCDDTNVCTDDTCDAATGCGIANNTASCAAASCDGLNWKQEMFCFGGACSAQTPTVNCDDGNPCTDDACDPATGCGNTNNTVEDCAAARCEGLMFYPAVDCSGGVCPTPNGVDCSDGDDCKEGICDPSLGCLTVHLEDLDHDGLCDSDACPTVWNPDNAAGMCPDLGDGFAKSRTLTLSEAGVASTWRRTNEPVEIPLWNGILDDSVVGYWKLDHGVATDSSGNGLQGTVLGASTSTGAFDDSAGGLHFDGQDDLVTVPAGPDGQTFSGLTTMLWFKADSGGQGVSVAVLYDATDSIHGDHAIKFVEPNYLSFTMSDLGAGCGNFEVGEWHHVAVTWNGSHAMCFMDGRLGTATPWEALVLGTTTEHQIGENYIGSVDEVVRFSRALSPSEIAAYYQSSKPYGTPLVPGAQPDFDDIRVTEVSPQQAEHVIPHEILGPRPHSDTSCPMGSDDGTWADRDDLCGVAAYWKFDGDSSELVSALETTEYGTVTSSGRFGNASASIHFDGTDDWLEVTPNSKVSFNPVQDDFTVETWVLFDEINQVGQTLVIDRLTGNTSQAFSLHLRDQGTFGFHAWWQSGTSECQGTSKPEVGTWNHLALVYKGGVPHLFVNGIEECKGVTAAEIDIERGLSVGRSCNETSCDYYLHGKLNDLVIHSIAKSPDYIYRRANPGVPTVRFLAHTEAVEVNGYVFLDYALNWGNPAATQVPPILTALDKTTECVGLLSPCLGYAGWWRFDEGSGTVAVDSSIFKANGVISTFNGAPVWTTGLAGGTALDFDGLDDEMRAPDIGQFNGMVDGFNIEVSIDPDLKEASLNRSLVDVEGGRTFSLRCNGSDYPVNQIDLGAANDAGTWFHALGPESLWANGTTSHLAASYDLDTLRLFAAWTEAASNTDIDGTLEVPTGTDFLVGNREPDEFDGRIDSVRVMSRALTIDEFLHYPLASWALEPCDVGGQVDSDCDGEPDATDCDPLNPMVFPGAKGYFNGIDDDCDGEIDELDECMVALPAGIFWMGSPQSAICPAGYPGVCEDEVSSAYNDNENLHYVKLTHPFEIQANEVTQGEFESVMGWNPGWFGPNGSGVSCGATCPVETVSWYDAVAYANEMSKTATPALTPCYEITDVKCEDGTTHGSDYMACMNTTQRGIDSATVTLNGASKPYDCTGYRLPTESEWEYAARVGSNTAFYPSEGNNGTITYETCALDPNLGRIGWYCGNSDNKTHPVGLNEPSPREPNAWGLYDMSGNVWEWAWDQYDGYYPAGTYSNPDEDPVVSPTGGSGRVSRGGSWYYPARDCRSANRHVFSPGARSSDLGFRLSRSLEACTPACTAKQCGGDGCGGSCGTCTGGKTCVEGQCEDVWIDPSTGLVWQNPSFDGTKTWEEAKTFCTNNEAGLPGTGWRLPNISELRSLIRGCPNTVTGGACGVTDVCPKCGVGQSCLSWSPCHDYCGYCFNGSGPADGCYWPNEMEGPCSWYWSSSPVEDNVYHAWLVYFSTGYVGNDVVNYARYVRCVR